MDGVSRYRYTVTATAVVGVGEVSTCTGGRWQLMSVEDVMQMTWSWTSASM